MKGVNFQFISQNRIPANEMVVGTLQLELKFHRPQSLKEKRMILKSLTTRLKREFNISVAEIDGMNLWQRSILAIAAVSRQGAQVQQTLNYVTDYVGKEDEVDIIGQQVELF